jgi:hypothetical protein
VSGTAASEPAQSRVVVLDGPATAALIEAMEREGETVCRAASLADIQSMLSQTPPPDAVVIDLSGGPGTGEKAGRAARGSSKRGASQPGAPAASGHEAVLRSSASGPFVLALTTTGALPPGAPLSPDVCVPAQETERAVREVRGALATRRLSAVMEELERLRLAVQHARRTAHDLAQPLTTIMARAQLLAVKLKPEDPHARPVGIICEESEKLARLIEQFQKLKVMSGGAGSLPD